MAEAKGILFEIQISEPSLKKLLNKSVDIILPDECRIDEQEVLTCIIHKLEKRVIFHEIPMLLWRF